jgi:heme O synthase-like polyprenyltransferase
MRQAVEIAVRFRRSWSSGIIGLFVGAVVLAMGYRLVTAGLETEAPVRT